MLVWNVICGLLGAHVERRELRLDVRSITGGRGGGGGNFRNEMASPVKPIKVHDIDIEPRAASTPRPRDGTGMHCFNPFVVLVRLGLRGRLLNSHVVLGRAWARDVLACEGPVVVESNITPNTTAKARLNNLIRAHPWAKNLCRHLINSGILGILGYNLVSERICTVLHARAKDGMAVSCTRSCTPGHVACWFHRLRTSAAAIGAPKTIEERAQFSGGGRFNLNTCAVCHTARSTDITELCSCGRAICVPCVESTSGWARKHARTNKSAT